ncbi:MAG: class I fructose-bisphosphate aldolase [Rickettsiales bacterium]|nr:class I fructose-bisphosphate aldolase [Rickettsiales bacterium]
MALTPKVKEILSWYEADSAATKENLARMLMHGTLGGTGKMVILPVDQGFEHGPARSFAVNPAAYNPHYHFQLAIDAGLNAYAAPLGMIEAGVETFKGKLPLILKVNSNNSLVAKDAHPDQAITATAADAERLGCAAVGFTIYPGSHQMYDQFEEIRDIAADAKARGLAVVIWSYPRGAGLSKDGETAIDVTAYAAHIAALLSAHIIKVKPPTAHIEQAEAKKVYEKENIAIGTLAERIAHIKQTTFGGRRLVIFSGGGAKSSAEVLEEVRGIAAGGADGSIMGRNAFQRPRDEALALLSEIVAIYKAAK